MYEAVKEAKRDSNTGGYASHSSTLSSCRW